MYRLHVIYSSNSAAFRAHLSQQGGDTVRVEDPGVLLGASVEALIGSVADPFARCNRGILRKKQSKQTKKNANELKKLLKLPVWLTCNVKLKESLTRMRMYLWPFSCM